MSRITNALTQKQRTWLSRLRRYNTLKLRIILSHLLPILVIIPLVSLSVYYAIQMQIVTNDINKVITREYDSIQNYARSNPEIWNDPDGAKYLMQQIQSNLISGIVIFDQNFHFLANEDHDLLLAPLTFQNDELKPMEEEIGDKIKEKVNQKFNPIAQRQDEEKDVEIIFPVMSADNQPIGMIRLHIPSDFFDSVLEGLKLRTIIVLLAAAILSTGIAILTSHAIEQRLNETTKAISDLATGVRNQPLPVSGPPELSRLSDAFNTLSSKLEESEQTRRKLLSYLGHELGRPLGGLASATDALIHGAHADERFRVDLLQGMKNEIHRLELLVNDLSLLRSASDPMTIYLIRRIDLNEWMAELVTYWAEFMALKNMTLRYEIAENLPVVQMDDRRIHQALDNLLNNAIKYSPPNGTVTLKTRVADNAIKISVTDHGVGIQPEDMPFIFQAFYRGENKKRFVQGMGVGLTITRNIIHAHHGEISVTSVPNAETTFLIRLPIEKLEGLPLGELIQTTA